METPLVLLYTANIRGDLNLLPRLYTFIRVLQRDQTDAIYDVLVDLGQSCAPDMWHCDVTQGRSTLLVLDAMGYDAANVADSLTPENREKFAEQVAVNLVDAKHPFEKNGVRFVGDVGRGVLAGRPYFLLVNSAGSGAARCATTGKPDF